MASTGAARERVRVRGVAWGALAATAALLGVTACGSSPSAKSATTSSSSTSTSSTVSSATSTVGGTTSTTGASRTTTTHGPTTATTKPVNPVTMRLTESANGKTITVGRGSTIVVVLSSTYWGFPTPPNAAVLQEEGQPVPAPILPPACIPGGGCGTMTATFKAVGAGRATISASRTACGEALRCTPDKASYTVYVAVTG